MIFGILTCDDRLGTSKHGAVPWHSPRNDKWVKAITSRSMIVMTRTEYERQLFSRPTAMPSCPFNPDSMTFVLSSNPMYHAPGASVIHSWREMLRVQKEYFPSMRMYIVGGTTIWREAITDLQGIYVTHIEGDFGCDRHFPFTMQGLREHGFNEAKSLEMGERSVMQFPLIREASGMEPKRTIRLFYRGEIEDNLEASPTKFRLNGT